MTNQELLDLSLDTMTEEEARGYGIEILREEIDRRSSAIPRSGLFLAVLLAIWVVTGTEGVLSYAVMGVAAYAGTTFFDHLIVRGKLRKQLKQYENRTYDKGYIEFVRQCQEHARKHISPEKKEQEPDHESAPEP